VINSWNPAAEELFGYPADRILGKHLQILVPPGLQNELGLYLKKAAEGEYVRHHEMKMVRQDGTPLDVLITISPIRGDHGTVVGASSIVRDITREKLERHMRDHEDRYRKLVADIDVGIYRSTADPTGHFVWGNTALLDILGYPSFNDLQGIQVIDLFSEPEGRLDLIGELRKSGFVKNRILHLKRRDEKPITVCVTALAEFDDHQNVKFINGIVQDVTGRVRS